MLQNNKHNSQPYFSLNISCPLQLTKQWEMSWLFFLSFMNWKEGRRYSSTEQKVLAAQEGPMEEQADPCSPWAPYRADVHMQPWRGLWCSSGWDLKTTAHGYPHSSSPRPELQPVGSIPQWGRRAGGAMWSSAWRMGMVIRSHVGVVLGELLPVGSPHRISSGRTASCGRNPTSGQ